MRKEDYLLQGQSTERDREMLKFDQICNNIMVIPQQQKGLDAELLEFGGFSVGTRRCQKSHEHRGGEQRKDTLLVILLHLELLITTWWTMHAQRISHLVCRHTERKAWSRAPADHEQQTPVMYGQTQRALTLSKSRLAQGQELRCIRQKLTHACKTTYLVVCNLQSRCIMNGLLHAKSTISWIGHIPSHKTGRHLEVTL